MISIIIPVYNASRHIKNCLYHISRLNYGDYEVIIIDDASTDDSCAIAKQMGYAPIRKERSEGPAAVRNLGAKNAKGNILFFVDSDVYLRPNTLNRIEALLIAHSKVSGVVFIYSLEHPNKNLVSLYKNFSIRMEESQKPNLTQGFRFSAFAIKKEAFEKIGGIDHAPCCEELEFGIKLIENDLVFYLDKEMNIVHAKSYSLKELIKADFLRAYSYFKIFLKNRECIQKNYSKLKLTIHQPFVQLFGVALSGLFLISSLFYATGINLILCFLTIATVAVSEVGFLKYAHSSYGLVFALSAFMLRNLEIAIGESAMIFAVFNMALKKVRRRV